MKGHPSPHASQARRGPLKGGRPSTSPTLAAGPCTGAAVLLAAVLALTACDSPAGGPADRSTTDGTADGATQQADGDLTVQIDRGNGTPAETYALGCLGDATGDLADPAAVCAHLQGLPDPFAPLPADVMCTEQFGGPQTARVTGRWEGEPVDLALSRTDGCQISQWDALGPLLPGPVG